MSNDKNFSTDDINYVSKLALLDISEEEKENLSNQLNSILTYFKKLNDLDTENIKPTRHPIEGLNNIFREDKPWEGLSIEEALSNSKHKKDGYFKAPRILKD